MTTVGFIGLGIMGSPMAAHLVRAGYDVIGYNRSPAKIVQLVEAGGRAADSIAAAVGAADVVALMVPDTTDVQDVLTGSAGVFEHGREGALIIDFSSIRPDAAAEFAQQAGVHGYSMVDAPVSGGEAGAKNAALSIMVGGSDANFRAAEPILNVLGKTVVHVGPSGSGQTVKAANQLIVAGNIALLAEAVMFLEGHGVDLRAAVQVLAGGLAGSRVLDQKAQKMLERSYDPGFRVELHHKDLGIVTSAARNANVAIPVSGVVAQLMASAVANGDGHLDHSALFKTIERLCGRT